MYISNFLKKLLAPYVACLMVVWAPTSGAEEVQPGYSAELSKRNMRFEHIDTLSGLSQDAVMAIAQDQYGFVWLGTEEGLNRYDGQQVKQFERDPFDKNSLSHNWVFALHVARDGTLWVGTDGGGISLYDSSSETFTSLRHDPEDENTISSDRVRAILQDRSGNFWVGLVGDGLNRIDAKTGTVTRYNHDPEDQTSLPHDSVLTLFEDRRGSLWIGTDGGGLARYESATGSFSRYQHTDDVDSLGGNQVSTIVQDRDGAIWVGTRDAGLDKFDTSTGTFEHFTHDASEPSSLSSNYVRAVLEDFDGTLWVATEKGLNEWRPNVRGFVRYSTVDTDPTSLAENRLTRLFQSNDGVLWVASYRGVNTWNYLSDAFTHYRKDNGMLGADTVTSIGESSVGELWIGAYGGGLTHIDQKTQVATHLLHDPNNSNSLSSNRVMALFVDRNDVVWAGTRRSGLNRLDPSNGEFRHIATPALSNNSVSVIYGDPDGTLWVGTYGGGLNRIFDDGADIKHYRHDTGDVTSLGGDKVLAITRDKSGSLWVGTENGGLNRFLPESDGFERFNHDPSDVFTISSNTAWEITETSDGSLWIATKNDGLNQWKPEDRQANRNLFVKWTKANGLRSNTIYSLLEDNIGQLWLSSNRGITRVDLSTHEMRHYDRRNGLVADEFTWGARFRSRSGQLIFGGSAGAVAFDAGEIHHNTYVPPAVVKAFSPVTQLAVSYQGVQPDQPALITHEDNYVAFEFSALDHTSPDKNEFRYILEGVDPTWQIPQDTNRVIYSNLDPGDYTFRLKVANSDGVWNEAAGMLPLTVLPPPWRTVWAYVLYAVAFAFMAFALLWFYLSSRRRHSQRRAELEQEVLQRTSELGDRNSQLEALNTRLLETSYTDSLTGLYNRRFLDQFIEKEIVRVDRANFEKRNAGNNVKMRHHGDVLFFMMIDLDGFKTINDKHGHSAGDRALLQVRDQLSDCLRDVDTIVRWGGDEFLVIGHTQGLSGIANLAERVCLAVSEHTYDLGGGRTGFLSCSAGAIPYPFVPLKNDCLNWEQSLNLADACAYIVKANGRNGWLVLSGGEKLSQAEALTLPAALAGSHAAGRVQIISSLKEPLDLTVTHKSVA